MVNKYAFQWIISLAVICLSGGLTAQDNYPDNNQVKRRLQALASGNSNASLQSLGKTTAGNDIWALTLSSGSGETKPAIAVVGGVSGDHLLGTELALRFAEDVLKNKSDLLEKTTFYVFPDMSPDATAQFFDRLRYNRTANARATDDDRDGEVNEDPFEDLDGNGVITLMRVEDPTGDYIPHPADDRIMIKANRDKGERGRYKIYSEGIDNDGDYRWNEDGPGGIDFNKNMSYRFPYFESGAGEHPVSEIENRALLDFLYTKWNLFAIFTFGPQNNLSAPLKHNPSGTSKRVITSILKQDANLNQLISEKYNEVTGTEGGKLNAGKGGDFFQWAYFHFGKLSLSTPGWWVPAMKIDKNDSTTVPNKDKNQEVNFIRWAEKENLDNYFTEWQTTDHPDFKDRKVEIGGLHPYVLINPPYKMVDEISTKHNAFLYELAAMQPQVKIVNLTTKPAGNQLTRITAEVYNDGTLPTHTEMGDRSRWLRKVKVMLNLKDGQQILSGKKIELIDRIEGDRSVRFTWLVQGKGSITITAGAPHTGTDQITVALNK